MIRCLAHLTLTQQSQPLSFVPQPQMPYLAGQDDEKRGLGLDPGQQAGYLGLTNQLHYSHHPDQSFGGYQPMPFRPSLGIDTTGPGFQHQQVQLPSAQTSAPSTSIAPETASLHDGERIITPGMQYDFNPTQYSYQPDYNTYAAPPVSSHQLPPHWTDYITHTNQTPIADQSRTQFPAQPPGTISPSQLSHENLKPLRTFSDLMMNSRASSSSASSTDGGGNQDLATVLDDWTKPVARALAPLRTSPNPAVAASTVPEPARRSAEVQWAVPPAPPKVKNPSFAVPGKAPTVPNPDALAEALSSYIHSPNRLAAGERKITVMSPKVGQKSYGTEKRFLCPHPQAVLVGGAWWHSASDGCPKLTRLPPRVNISLDGEQTVKDATVSWTTVDGKNLDEKINTETLKEDEEPFIGNVAGRNLHISDSDSKRRESRAKVVVRAPYAHHAGTNGWGPAKGTMSDITNDEIIGQFDSKDIKIISKPSKKKANAKSSELLIQHGTTIALFNRVKSQTTSTRYLSVTPDPTRILGSDGRPVQGAVPPPLPTHRTAFPGFTAHATTWESFIIWLADPNKAPGPGNNAPLHPDWPSAPNNAMSAPHFSPPIRYNSTVVLQSLQTGICSPVLIIRRVEQDADVVGGDGTSSEVPTCLPEGEMAGDLVSQLQKVAFEVHRPEQLYMAPIDHRWGGVWLSCDQEMVQDKVVHADRRWAPVPMPAPPRGGSRPNSLPSTPSSRYGVLPMTPHTNLNGLPSVGTPSVPSSPNSTTSSLDYFGAHSRKASSTSLVSPAGGLGDMALPSTDGGPVRRHRTGSASAVRGPFARPGHKKRQSGDVSSNSSYEYILNANGGSPGEMGPRSFWTMSVGDVCIWSIVSTEQQTYTFFVPPYVKTTSEPYAPMPSVTRILPPDAAIDSGRHVGHVFTARTTKPLVTVYGKGFLKNQDSSPHHLVYYNSDPAEYNEGRW